MMSFVPDIVEAAKKVKITTIYSDWEGSYCCGHEYKQIDGRWFLYRNRDEDRLTKFDQFLSRLEKEPALENDLVSRGE